MWLIPTHKLGLPCHTTATNQRRHATATKYQVTFCECRPHPQLEDMKTKCGTVRRSGENWSSGQLLHNQDAHYQFLGSCSRLGRRQGGGRILYQVNYEENRASGTVCQTSVIPELHLFVENHLIHNGPIQSNPVKQLKGLPHSASFSVLRFEPTTFQSLLQILNCHATTPSGKLVTCLQSWCTSRQTQIRNGTWI